MTVNLGDLIEKIFDNFKKVTPVLVTVSILSALILFLPKSVLVKMSLDNLPDFWKIIIGLAFLFSTTMIATIVLLLIFKYICLKIMNKMTKIEQKKKFKKLSESHKIIIVLALSSREKLVFLNTSSGDAIYLQNNNFLYNPSQVPIVRPDDEIFERFAPREWLIDLYNEEPELFEEIKKRINNELGRKNILGKI